MIEDDEIFLLPEYPRPTRRGQCLIRPCPFASCKYHLLTSLPRALFHEHDDDYIAEFILELPETCALDIANRGPQTLDTIGKATLSTRENIRQLLDGTPGVPGVRVGRKSILSKAKKLAQTRAELRGLIDHLDYDPGPPLTQIRRHRTCQS